MSSSSCAAPSNQSLYTLQITHRKHVDYSKIACSSFAVADYMPKQAEYTFDLAQSELDLAIAVPDDSVISGYGNGLGFLLAHNAFVQVLRMRHAAPSNEALEELALALRTNATLITLDLSGQWLSAERVRDLCEALTKNSTLTELNLTSRDVSLIAHWKAPDSPDAQAQALSYALRNNASLRVVGFANHSLSQKGLNWIAEGLRRNNSLHGLDISDARVAQELDFSETSPYHHTRGEPEGAIDARMLQNEKYAEALLNVVRASPSLTTLMLSRKQVLQAGFEALKAAVLACPTLEHLSPPTGKSWLPGHATFQHVDHAVIKLIQPAFFALTKFEQENPISAGSNERKEMIHRLEAYQFIYRSICENIFNNLSPKDKHCIYFHIWSLSGKPGELDFGEKNVFTDWNVFWKAVAASDLQEKFPALFDEKRAV